MRSRRKLTTQNESQSRDRWLISYADLVTLLLALFIVMYGASDRERAKAIAESFSGQSAAGEGILPADNGKKEEKTASEIKLLENQILQQKTKIKQTERGLIVSLSEAGFFAPGDATVSAEAQNVIETLAQSLQNNRIPIRIEGHTDAIPISNLRYNSNWELSTSRAANVLQKLVENGITPERLSASGYGGFQPVADNSTPEGRAQNRRVDIVILNR
ncbi:MAG: OmpA family protein [Blastocatellia bacterium]|nr:OmpA family protein [Blastocatellia bacterium]